MEKQFLTGVIEGYYGRCWEHQTRLDYARYLASSGLNTCIYCPKGDPYLRKHWQQHWPEERWRELHDLAEGYAEQGILWGVGLSPFELYRDYGASSRQQLRNKIRQLGELRSPLLAILFDDMPGDLPDLAARQAEIVADVCAMSPGVRILVCPTYYSFDPVLEKHFGSMPEDYWGKLGSALPAEVDIFWTGNKVCSESVVAADIERINSELGRPVTLWDNYPVNDGAVRSNYLYCEKLGDRDPSLAGLIDGHLCNPMNQGLLSLPALAGLAELYGLDRHHESWLLAALGESTLARLREDGEQFQQLGLSGLGAERAAELATFYAGLPGNAAAEVAAWLRGEYTFDPACLTD